MDDNTVELVLTGLNPVAPRELTDARIMNKAWAEQHPAVRARDFSATQESCAKGPGPFRPESWPPDIGTRLMRKTQWWCRPKGNVDVVVFAPLKCATRRASALISGVVDMRVNPPAQDLVRLRRHSGVQVIEGPEHRTAVFGLGPIQR